MLRQLASALPRCHSWAVQSRAAVAVRGLKTHTGIAGLDVDPNARENLKSFLQQALEAIKVIPQEAEYRQNVENTINQKLSFVTSDITDEEVEDKLDAQLEQYINFVKDELSLIPKMAGVKPASARHVCTQSYVQITTHAHLTIADYCNMGLHVRCRVEAVGSPRRSQGTVHVLIMLD